MSPDRQQPSGLTLIEMMIVIALMGILLALAAPNIGLFTSGYKLRGAAREAATDLQYARLLAIKENRDFRVTFDSNSYQVVRVSDGKVVKTRSFSTDYSDINLTNVFITFDSRGTFDPLKNSGANTATLTVSNPRGMKNVTVGRTGRVKIE